jgi:ribosome-associated toxin RatA of RatAB toxin-antitoxin module
VTTVERSIELPLPAAEAYRLVADFETYPLFLAGVESVRRVGDTRLEWAGVLAGERREWPATITEMAPEASVAWTSTDGPGHTGVIALEPLAADRTLVTVRLDYAGGGEDPLGELDALERLAGRRAQAAPPPPEGTAASLASALGAPVEGPLGEPVGTIADAFVDPDSHRVTYVAVAVGPLEPARLVPVAPVAMEELWRGVVVACDRDRLAAAPPVEPGVDPSDDDLARARAAVLADPPGQATTD